MEQEIFNSESDDRVVIHFNKASIQDDTLAEWVVKHKGKTYYCNEVFLDVPSRTKNTKDNPHTKGVVQAKGLLKIVRINNSVIARINPKKND